MQVISFQFMAQIPIPNLVLLIYPPIPPYYPNPHPSLSITTLLLRSMQLNHHPRPTTARQRQVMQRLPAKVLVLHLIKALQQTHDHVRRLGERELLADTDAWAAVELRIVSRVFPCGVVIRCLWELMGAYGVVRSKKIGKI